MLAMMFNYINEETVMAARLVSCWKPLYLGERREEEREERMMWSEGKNGLIIDHQVQVQDGQRWRRWWWCWWWW